MTKDASDAAAALETTSLKHEQLRGEVSLMLSMWHSGTGRLTVAMPVTLTTTQVQALEQEKLQRADAAAARAVRLSTLEKKRTEMVRAQHKCPRVLMPPRACTQ